MASTQFDNVDISCLDVEFELARMKTPLLIVFDDFDEILNLTDLAQFATLMKVLSDNAVDAKLILVGSPRAATHFKRAHMSVQRNLHIIHLDGLHPVKAKEFLVDHGDSADFEIMDDALSLAMELSCGLPYLPGHRQTCRSFSFVSQKECNNRSRRRRGYRAGGRKYPFDERNQLKTGLEQTW